MHACLVNQLLFKNISIFAYSVFLCFVRASMNMITEAMKHIETAILLMIILLSGMVLNSPQVGLQRFVLFSSNKKPSEHTS